MLDFGKSIKKIIRLIILMIWTYVSLQYRAPRPHTTSLERKKQLFYLLILYNSYTLRIKLSHLSLHPSLKVLFIPSVLYQCCTIICVVINSGSRSSYNEIIKGQNKIVPLIYLLSCFKTCFKKLHCFFAKNNVIEFFQFEIFK